MRAAFVLLVCSLGVHGQIRTWEEKVTIPTYTPSGRELEPALFAASSVTGLYPFTTYLMPYEPGGPKPRDYHAVFIENEYLRLTYLPEFGGRIYSVFDKLRNREMFYRNDVVKPVHYNPRNSWVQSGIEITGPHDLHMLTLNGEPFWSHEIIRGKDGSVSLVLGENDPVYRMRVNLTATLYPGVAALEMGVNCYNGRDSRMPQMIWLSAALPATEKTRFLYPMSRTIGHTTSEIADWPVFNGVDFSWDRNNQHMLGVFGIDIYDDYQGAYRYDDDYGVFRYADRRMVQGMKMWTFGYGANSKILERGYTDNAGPYVEVQSGRHVWDGNYEWVEPHRTESWNDWWIPIAGLGGLTTIRRDVALRVEARDGGVSVDLVAIREIPGARINLGSGGIHLSRLDDLLPGRTWHQFIPGVQDVAVAVSDRDGRELLNYVRPEENPGRKEYTPITRPLEDPKKKPERMSADELVVAADARFKELKPDGAIALLEGALRQDEGFSRARLLLGIHAFTERRFLTAEEQLARVIQRDPYLDAAHYYLAMARFALGKEKEAERGLYFVWPGSAYYGAREYQLGRLDLQRGDVASAIRHLETGLGAWSGDLNARALLAIALRVRGDLEGAQRELDQLERFDPTSAAAAAERYLLDASAASEDRLLRRTGAQSQEALDVSAVYRMLGRWGEAVKVLQAVERKSKDPWGTPAEFYYVAADGAARAGDKAAAALYREKAVKARKNIDRFPFREESEAPLRAATTADPKDATARWLLGCLLYHQQRKDEAIREWEAAVAAEPKAFSVHRALGLANAEQGLPGERASAELERAVQLDPSHLRTLNDLSLLYARSGRFDSQLKLLEAALQRAPGDDRLAEGVLTADLALGRYADANQIAATRRFGPQHRTYALRDKYRMLRYGMGVQAYKAARYAEALSLFESAMKPPVNLGLDDFEHQPSPRIDYAIGRALEALGRKAEAVQAYERCTQGVAQLSGDRDSWNSDNFHMLLALDHLGRTGEASRLAPRFESFASQEIDSKSASQRAEALFLTGLVRKRSGDFGEARKLMQSAATALPDFLLAVFELRGDSLDPLPQP